MTSPNPDKRPPAAGAARRPGERARDAILDVRMPFYNLERPGRAETNGSGGSPFIPTMLQRRVRFARSVSNGQLGRHALLLSLPPRGSHKQIACLLTRSMLPAHRWDHIEGGRSCHHDAQCTRYRAPASDPTSTTGIGVPAV